MITQLNQRSREVFREIVDLYLESGEPVGSRTVSRRLTRRLSPATIRNVMSDLEEAGLLFAPHTSAGRQPTDAGLRLYVDGLLAIGELSEEERSDIEARCAGTGRSVETVMTEASNALSGLSRYAGLVVAPKTDQPFKHVEFVALGPGRAMVVVVTENGLVENRLFDVPLGMSASTLVEAGNYLTAKLSGRSFGEARTLIEGEIKAQQSQLDDLTQKVVETGLAIWSGERSGDDNEGVLIVKGQVNLLDDVTNLVDLERIRTLFSAIDTNKSLLRLIDLTEESEGVQIFIGAENELFGLSGCSMVVAPYRNGANTGSQVLGTVGVLGPLHMNYSRIVPMVDYTARVMGRLLGAPASENQNV
ncbi:MAG: heat-inducible transcriptional repressor HrcA [Geminicoccaceae bacterium]